MLDWFNSREAAEIGTALADEFAPRMAATVSARTASSKVIAQLLQRADGKVRSLRLTLFKKAKFANSFKWRLIENGVARETADELTQSLVLHLFAKPRDLAAQHQDPNPVTAGAQHSTADRRELLRSGNQAFERGAYTEAAQFYQELLELEPKNADALRILGEAFSKLGMLSRAAHCFRRAIEIKPDYAEAHYRIPRIVLRWKGKTPNQKYLAPAVSCAEIHSEPCQCPPATRRQPAHPGPLARGQGSYSKGAEARSAQCRRDSRDGANRKGGRPLR